MSLNHWFPLTSLLHQTQPVYVRATAPLPAEENAAQLWTMDRGYLVNKRTAYGIYVILLEKEEGERGGGGENVSYHCFLLLTLRILKVLGIKNGTVFK
jgi:hypothetical protein